MYFIMFSPPQLLPDSPTSLPFNYMFFISIFQRNIPQTKNQNKHIPTQFGQTCQNKTKWNKKPTEKHGISFVAGQLFLSSRPALEGCWHTQWLSIEENWFPVASR